MFGKNRRVPAWTVPMLLGLGLAGAAIGAVQAGSGDEALSCEIRAGQSNGMITLEGTVHATVATVGSYRFRVSSVGQSGGTNIQQGGNFNATPGNPATLGRVMLGNAGAIYDADLEIKSNGTTIACSERVGGAI